MAGSVERFIQSLADEGLTYRALALRVQARRFSAAALATATRSRNRLVRETVASIAIPPRLFAALAADTDPVVRLAVASNQVAPTQVLRRLAEDSVEAVRLSACAELQWRRQLSSSS